MSPQDTAGPKSIVATASRFDPCWHSFRFRNAAGNASTVCEIGCYPGRYLAYVASKFGLRALGIDLNEDVDTVVHHLKAMGVDDFPVERDDFLTCKRNLSPGAFTGNQIPCNERSTTPRKPAVGSCA